MCDVRGLILDIGGVLVEDRLLETIDRWSRRLTRTPAEMLAAIYGGNDEAVLVGRVTEDDWWQVVGDRLQVDTSELRVELESGQLWNKTLVEVLREVTATTRTGILSNAWPSQRSRMVELGLGDLVHELLLSCEIGYAKPSVEAFRVAQQRLGTRPRETLFVDDTAGHVEVATTLGICGHVHTTAEGTVEAIRAFLARP